MIVPRMTGLRMEVRKETLAVMVNAQTLTQISILTIETLAQLAVSDTVHLILFGLPWCCVASQAIKTENFLNQLARFVWLAESHCFSLIDQF